MHDVKPESLVRATLLTAVTAFGHSPFCVLLGAVLNLQRFSPCDAMLPSGMLSHGLGVLEVDTAVWTRNPLHGKGQRCEGKVFSMNVARQIGFTASPMLQRRR